MSKKKEINDPEIHDLREELNLINEESDKILEKRRLKKQISKAKTEKILIKLGLKNKKTNGK